MKNHTENLYILPFCTKKSLNFLHLVQKSSLENKLGLWYHKIVFVNLELKGKDV